MTQILNDVCGLNAEVRNTHYSFYRDTEWLKYYIGNYSYVLCAQNEGDYLTICQSYYGEDGDIATIRYEVLNGYGKLEYLIA